MGILFLLGLAAVGLGAPLANLLAPIRGETVQQRIGNSGLIGLFVAASLATILNFFMPIRTVAAIAIFVLGLISFIFLSSKVALWQWLLYTAVVVAVTPLAIFLEVGYDGGLYHLPHQFWLVTEKIVFGLANLHGRFGFNSMAEPLLALGWLGGEDLTVVQLIGGLFSLFFLIMIVEGVREDGDHPVLVYVLCMLWLGFVWTNRQTQWMGWTSTDLPTAIAVATCGYCGFKAAVKDDHEYLVLAFFFAAFAAALKLSGAFVGIFPVGLTLIWVVLRGWRDLPLFKIILVGALFLPYIARNIIVSGCFLYPLQLTCLPVPWEASRNAARDAIWIEIFAQSRHEHLMGWEWFPTWLERNENVLIRWIVMVLVGLALAVSLMTNRLNRRTPWWPILVFSIYSVVATALWFWAAPEPRFGMAHIVSLAMLPGLWLIATDKHFRSWFPSAWVPAILMLASLAFGIGHSLSYAQTVGWSLLGYEPLTIPIVETTTDGRIRHPAEDDRCYLTPPPCSPFSVGGEDHLGSYRAYYSTE